METVGARVRQAIQRRAELGWAPAGQATAAADALVEDWAPVARLADLAVRFGLLERAGTDVLLTHRVVVADRVAEHLAGNDLPPAFLLPLFVEPVPIDVEGTGLIRTALAEDHRLVWVHTVTGGAGVAMA